MQSGCRNEEVNREKKKRREKEKGYKNATDGIYKIFCNTRSLRKPCSI
jgi:hypothetical protein